MSIKISQFNTITAVDANTILPVVDPLGPDSYKATLSQLKTFILDGNATTATNLDSATTTLASTVLYSSLTSVGTLTNLTVTNTISGSINGNAATVTNGVYTTDTGTVTNTMLAGSIANNKLANSTITINGTAISLGGSGTVTASIATATTSILGAVIVGDNLTVAVDGTIAVDTSTIATKTYVDNTSTDNAISFSVALG